MGGELTAERVARLRCAVICGGANNQLATRDIGRRLAKEGILYVPDYLANAGGLINVAGEMRSGGYNKRWVEKKIKDIGKTTRKILLLAKKRKRPANEVADEVAWSRVSGKG
jgi:glutamate dehydrogenase/leucine dehydrogenase